MPKSAANIKHKHATTRAADVEGGAVNTKRCVNCGSDFQATDTRKLMCSPACRRERIRQQGKARASRTTLTIERLRRVVSYDPETGVFRWKVRRGGSAKEGTIAGALIAAGYRKIVIDDRQYRANRLAWLYVYGRWPDGEVDHKNNIRHDDRLINLREATDEGTSQNAKLGKNNTSGFKGVTWHSQRGKWKAQISVDHRCVHLGLYNNVEDAHAAYCAAATRYFGEFARFA